MAHRDEQYKKALDEYCSDEPRKDLTTIKSELEAVLRKHGAHFTINERRNPDLTMISGNFTVKGFE